tara:strand:+ start:329 stop:496 length:168 start_codon:yes stop_codon:yes gene_type:complete
MATVKQGKFLHLYKFTNAERDALTPVAGMIIYNTDTNKLNFFNGTNWRVVDDSAV